MNESNNLCPSCDEALHHKAAKWALIAIAAFVTEYIITKSYDKYVKKG